MGLVINAQQLEGPSTIATGTFIGKTEPLRDLPIMQPIDPAVTQVKIIENNLRANEKVNDNALPLGPDEIRQYSFGNRSANALGANFDGSNIGEAGGFLPPDPTGAVGPNHYVHAVNVVVKIFDKEGNLLTGPTFLGDFLQSGNNNGDPIVMYDHLADRFFVSQFRTADDALIIGVSETPDPTGAYNLYEYPLDDFPDYPHYSVWPDGYYLTANKFEGNTTYVLDREAMINGDPDPGIIGFNLPGVVNNTNTVFSPEPANLTGFDFPADIPGYIVYLQDDGWGGIDFDHLKIWEIDIDFENPGNSTISEPLEVATEPYDSVFAPFGEGDIEQPGTTQKISSQAGIISYAANYRSFEDYNSWLITFNVDVDGNDTSGIRWIELRNSDTQGWSIFQEGTYAPDDGQSRFMSSAAMDAFGNVGLAFNIGSENLATGIRYTGRFVDDPLGELTLDEVTIVDGIGVNTGNNRFGDYAHLTVDPNQFSFWHTSQYFNGANAWFTRVAEFSLSGGFATDVGVNGILSPANSVLTDAENVQVSIRNFGTDTQTEIPLELRIDGVLVATETWTGSLDANSTATYTFVQTVDLSNLEQTYEIQACTVLTGDELINNDCDSSNVTNLIPNDLGIDAIVAPITSSGLGVEDVIISITNFGGNVQSNFEVEYAVNGGTPITEVFTGNIMAEETVEYTFTTQADLSSFETYTLNAAVNLDGDSEPVNNTAEATVTNSCTPTAVGGCQFRGIKRFVLNTIDVDNGGNGCNTEPAGDQQGYADRTDLSTILSNVAGQNTYLLQAQHNFSPTPSNMAFSAWIDFNDNGIFEVGEQLIDGELFEVALALDDFDLIIPTDAPTGEHVLRVRSIDITQEQANTSDPCLDYTLGETQDYTVVIEGEPLSLDDEILNNSSDLVVKTIGKNKFEVSLNSEIDARLYLAIYNLLGQQLTYKPMGRDNNIHTMEIDMSAAATGVYLLRVGGLQTRSFKSTKIIVE